MKSSVRFRGRGTTRLLRSLVANTGWAGVGEVGRGITQALLLVLLARAVGPSDFGRFVAATALFQLIAPLAWMGSLSLMVRRFARAECDLSAAYSTATTTVLIYGGVGALLATAIASPLLLTGMTLGDVLVLAVSELVATGLVETSATVGIAKEDLRGTAAIRWVTGILRLAGLIVVITMTPGGLDLSKWYLAYLLSNLAAAVVGYFVVRFLSRVRLGVSLPNRGQLRIGLEFSLIGTAYMVQDNVDKPLILWLDAASAAGVYAAAYRVVNLALVPLRAVLQATFARFFREGKPGLNRAMAMARQLSVVGAVFATFSGVILFVLAEPIATVFGSGFEEVAEAVRWLAFLPLARVLSSFVADALTGGGHNPLRVKLQLGFAGANILMSLMLIPLWGWRGAAFATLASEFSIAIAMWVAARCRMKMPTGSASSSHEPNSTPTELT